MSWIWIIISYLSDYHIHVLCHNIWLRCIFFCQPSKVKNFNLHNILKEVTDLFNHSNGIVPFSSWNLFAKVFIPTCSLFDLRMLNSVCLLALVCSKFKSSQSFSGNLLLNVLYSCSASLYLPIISGVALHDVLCSCINLIIGSG